MSRQLLETEQKALEINLNASIYGSFAEIGAGQEVARHFFQAGAAAGTIAKTISAYDKVVSDEIYGAEAKNRYVCESRLYKMLDHEYELTENRLVDERPETCFFAFADTVSTINYYKTNQGHGWLGLRFQLDPKDEPNELILHVQMLDNNTLLQQQAIGILGVNMLYACYYYKHNYKTLIYSLVDGIYDRVHVDMVRLRGPQFDHIDPRLYALELVRNKMTDVAIFNAKGEPVHASEFMYKKNVLVVRGSYRPFTRTHQDMYEAAIRQFKEEPEVEPRHVQVLSEITLEALGENEKIDEQDYLDRVELLNKLGHQVMLSNCNQHKKLIRYILQNRVKRLALVTGARDLLEILNDKYKRNLDGRLLTSFGEIFTRDVCMYVYPTQQEGSGELMTSRNLPLPEDITHLFAHVRSHGHVMDLLHFDPKVMHIRTREVLRMLRSDEEGWEDMVTEEVRDYIKAKCLFGYPCQRMEFDY